METTAVQFYLPYIVLPGGEFEFPFRDEKFKIEVKISINHIKISELEKIISGYLSGEVAINALVGKNLKMEEKYKRPISGPIELYKGYSNINILFRDIPTDFAIDIRDFSVLVLNKIQNLYIFSSKKYWWNNISSDHFCEFIMNSGDGFSISKRLMGYENPLPKVLSDSESIDLFRQNLQDGFAVEVFEQYLIEAKRHYLTQEYHLMYIELSISFEHLMSKSFKKIMGFETQLFKEGKIRGQVGFILKTKCNWDSESIKIILEIIDTRNEVIHNNRRNFINKSQIFLHLKKVEEAILDIGSWLKI